MNRTTNETGPLIRKANIGTITREERYRLANQIGVNVDAAWPERTHDEKPEEIVADADRVARLLSQCLASGHAVADAPAGSRVFALDGRAYVFPAAGGCELWQWGEWWRVWQRSLPAK